MIVLSMRTKSQIPPFYLHSISCALALTCAVQASTPSAQGATSSFDGSRSYFALGAGQTGAAAVATGDFNGDGKTDMVAVTPDTDGVSVFLNQATGTFG